MTSASSISDFLSSSYLNHFIPLKVVLLASVVKCPGDAFTTATRLYTLLPRVRSAVIRSLDVCRYQSHVWIFSNVILKLAGGGKWGGMMSACQLHVDTSRSDAVKPHRGWLHKWLQHILNCEQISNVQCLYQFWFHVSRYCVLSVRAGGACTPASD
jgi:hypothetical protein